MEAAGSFFRPIAQESPLDVKATSPQGSLLAAMFNACWAQAVNGYVQGALDGFAMVHADVAAEFGWLDLLHEELVRSEADIISAVIPIKDIRGLTSTAVDDTGDEWRPRRLTLKEVQQLPETFTSEDVGGALLLNTGLWLCRLGPWCTSTCFQILDTLRLEGGSYVQRTQPEDWHFSRQLHSHGLKLAATTRVKVKHYGESPFCNYGPAWGWATDETNGTRPEDVQARERRGSNGASDIEPAMAGATDG